jgi:hypothetical protein
LVIDDFFRPLQPARVNRRTKLLLLTLAISVVFAAWQWFRPYDWSPDPVARFRVTHCIVKRDVSNLWLQISLKPRDGQVMDFSQPIHLLTAGGKRHEVAEMEQVGSGPEKTLPADNGAPAMAPPMVEEITFSFWLAEADFAGPMTLELNGASLRVRGGDTLPRVADGGFRVFNTSAW